MRIKILLYLLFGVLGRSFGQVIDYTIPAGYETEINAASYKRIVDTSIAVISGRFTVDSVCEGTVHLIKMQDVQAFHLNNLIAQCVAEKDTSKWGKIIHEHFEKLFSTLDMDDEVDPVSYKGSKKYLSLRIYPKDFITRRSGFRSMVVQSNLDDTYTVLMLDIPSAFVPVQRKNFNIWNKDIDEVFAIAQSNIAHQPVQKIKRVLTVDGMTMNTATLQNDDFAGSYALDLSNNSPELVGDWGAVVAIPNKGIAHVCKMDKNKPGEMIKFIEQMKSQVEKEYAGHPQRISNQFFWYYHNKFTPINVTTDKQGKVIVTPPTALTSMVLKSK